MSSTVTRSREKPHTSAAPTPAVAPVLALAAEVPVRPYRGDRWCLVFWLSCAGLLLALHVGQHVVYLLR